MAIQEKQICMICYDATRCYGCVCQSICIPCIKQYVEIEAREDHATIKCPGCKLVFDEKKLQLILSPELFKEWRSPRYAFRCPTCNGYCKDSRWSNRRVICRTCRGSWCVECKNPYHLFNIKGCSDRAFRRWRYLHRVQACPNCRQYIEKDSGCKHMTCARCRFAFCWTCRATWTCAHICLPLPSYW